MTVVVVFGGAGFLGRRLVHRLTAQGMTVRVAVRHPDPARIALQRSISTGSRSSPPMCAIKPRSPPPLLEPTPSSTRSRPMSRRVA